MDATILARQMFRCLHTRIPAVAIAGVLIFGWTAIDAAPIPQAANPKATLPVSITGISPKIAAAISPGGIEFPPEVTITGQGFRPGAQVTVGSQTAAIVSVTSTEIHVTVSGQAAGVVDLTVTNSDGSLATQPKAFTYTTGPFIYGISPQTGSAATPTVVEITGGNFTNDSVVMFGELAAPIQFFFSTSSIEVQVPANAAVASDKSVVAVTLKNSDGQSFTLPSAFTWTTSQAAPSISAPAPSPTSRKSIDPDSCGGL
jgi:large repetitive protein